MSAIIYNRHASILNGDGGDPPGELNPNLKLLLHLDGNMNNVTAFSGEYQHNNAIFNDLSKFGSKGLRIRQGSIRLGFSNTEINLDNPNWTFDFWLGHFGTGASNYTLMCVGDAGVFNNTNGAPQSGGGEDNLRIQMYGGHAYVRQTAIGGASSYYNTTMTSTTFNHFAIERTNSTFRTYENGIVRHTRTISGSMHKGTNLLIGNCVDGASDYGTISEFRYIKQSMYQGNNFTPPTAPYTGAET